MVCNALLKVSVVVQIVSFGMVVGILLIWVGVTKSPHGVLTSAVDIDPEAPLLMLLGPVIVDGLLPFARARCFKTVSDVRFLMACCALVVVTAASVTIPATKLLIFDIMYTY